MSWYLSNNNFCSCAWQHLIQDQEAVTKEMKEEMDAHRRKVDLEDQRVQRLIEINREEIQKAHTVR